MGKKQRTAIHIFRRDLRVQDNTALNRAVSEFEAVIPCFFFDPRQLAPHPYFSASAFSFMLESLIELDSELRKLGSKLHIFAGAPEVLLPELLKEANVTAVVFNRDYTPFAVQRDKKIQVICGANGIACQQHGDALLLEPELSLKPDGKPYTVFTPYFKRCTALPIKPVEKRSGGSLLSLQSGLEQPDLLQELSKKYRRPPLGTAGGRSNALSILSELSEYGDYEDRRDFPAQDATTRLSAHNKFGTCSIREVYYAILNKLGSQHALIRELHWRDFFTQIAHYHPHVFGAPFQKKYAALKWRDAPQDLARWKEGMTGYPIIDAGMRELNHSGYMHNRVRMITASFLTKHLQINWLEGEQYFAKQLVDYDPCVNNGNWQWAASTGCDAQPYFRVFNPWLQQKKFDSECDYIKKWVPELKDLSPKMINNPNYMQENKIKGYPSPIVDHDVARIQAIEMFELS